MARTDSIEQELREIAAQIAATVGVEVYDIVLRRSGPRWKLQVFLSRPVGEVTLADCETVSRQLSRELDVSDPIPTAYDLEVSSPGLERALRHPGHWRQAVGNRVKVRWRDEAGKAQTMIAALESIDGETATIRDDRNATHRVRLADVLSARIHVDWR